MMMMMMVMIIMIMMMIVLGAHPLDRGNGGMVEASNEDVRLALGVVSLDVSPTRH